MYLYLFVCMHVCMCVLLAEGLHIALHVSRFYMFCHSHSATILLWLIPPSLLGSVS